MLEAYADANAGAMMVRGIKHATGDGLLMAQAAGAGLKGMGGVMSLHIAAVDSVETAAGQPAFAVPYAISINRDGKRFIDESRGYVAHGKAVLGQPVRPPISSSTRRSATFRRSTVSSRPMRAWA